MSWAKVDDHANEHRKQLAAGAEACWLWTCGLMYANRQAARDGFIPEAAVGMLYPFKSAAYAASLALRLVTVGLWEATDGGYQIHEFTFWNEPKEVREDRMAQARERAAQSYARRKAQNSAPPLRAEKAQTPSAEKDVLQNSSGSTPLLSTPLPLPKSESAPEARDAHARPDEQATWDGSERETACPLDLCLRAKSLKIPEQLAERLKVDVEAVEASLREFVGYWTIGEGMGMKRRYWMRKAREHVRRSAGRLGGLAPPGALERHKHLEDNAAFDSREALDASRKVREMLAFSDSMKAGANVR